MSSRGKNEQRGALSTNRTQPETVGLLGGFEGLPYFGFSKNRSANNVEIDFQRRASHVGWETVHEIDRRWRVRASGSLGLPTRQDQDVYVAVVQILQDRGMPHEGVLWVSLYELVRILGWGEGHVSYDRIRRSLDRIGSTTIRSDNAFWSTRSNSYVSDTFSLWTYHTAFYKEALSGKHVKGHRLDFHRLFIENYLDNDLNQIDIEFYWSLKDHMAKRLYRLIEHYTSTQEDTQRYWDVDLFLVRDLMPLANYRHASQVKRAMKGAESELFTRGYLAKADERRESDGGRWITYKVSPRFARKRVLAAVECAPENQAALEMMKYAGIPRDVRLRVLQKYDPEMCLKFAALLPHQKNIENPVKAFQWALKNPVDADWWQEVAEHGGVRANNEVGETTGENGSEDAAETAGGANEEPPSAPPQPQPEALEVWNEVLEAAQEEINAPALTVWFEDTVPTSLENGVLTLWAPNSFARDYIESRFKEILEPHLSRVLGTEATIEVEAAKETEKEAG